MDPDENRRREYDADYRSYSVAGTHADIGAETAHRVGSTIRPGVTLDDDARAVARECREATRNACPELVEEIAAHADALSLTEDETLWHYAPGVDAACSAVAVRTGEGVVVGRNYDFYYFEDRRHLIHTDPDEGRTHVGMHEGLLGGRFDGLNDAGVFVAFNGAGEEEESAVGVPFHLVVRHLLETAETAADAVDRLLALPLRETKSYLLADAERAYVVEAAPSEAGVRDTTGGVVAATNHFHQPEMAPYAPAWPNSVARHERLRELAGDGTDGVGRSAAATEARVREALRDHEAPVCGHEDGLATFWSCTATLGYGESEATYALGAPCRNAYAWTVRP